MDLTELRKAVEEAELVDAHTHNIVAIDSSFPFISCLSGASGDALSYPPHSHSFKRNLKDVVRLYGAEKTLHEVEEHRRVAGLQSISSTCFKAARISAILIDDGLRLGKKHDIDWHKKCAPFVGRIFRIEYLAEEILSEVSEKLMHSS